MILKGSQRGGAKDMALHLLKPENDHVEVHELRGVVSQDLMGALNEMYAISRGTKCRQYLYSLSCNPPPREKVSTAEFLSAIDRAETELGLSGHARVIVFHEKEARRHAHVVWSRIDAETMTAVRMSHDYRKLGTLSRELFIEHGWKMPEGLAISEARDPKNFTLAEWQQAKRTGKDAKALRAAFQDAWAISDSKAAFVHAMEERGYTVARGDRRSFVAVDMFGEVYSIPRLADVRTKAVRERLGPEESFPDVEVAKAQVAQTMLEALNRIQDGQQAASRQQAQEFGRRKADLVRRQRMERHALADHQKHRREEESRLRQARFRRGLKGIWDTLRGENRRIRRLNEQEAEQAFERDRAERDLLIQRHLAERRRVELFKFSLRRDLADRRMEIEQDRRIYEEMRSRSGPNGPSRGL